MEYLFPYIESASQCSTVVFILGIDILLFKGRDEKPLLWVLVALVLTHIAHTILLNLALSLEGMPVYVQLVRVLWYMGLTFVDMALISFLILTIGIHYERMKWPLLWKLIAAASIEALITFSRYADRFLLETDMLRPLYKWGIPLCGVYILGVVTHELYRVLKPRFWHQDTKPSGSGSVVSR